MVTFSVFTSGALCTASMLVGTVLMMFGAPHWLMHWGWVALHRQCSDRVRADNAQTEYELTCALVTDDSGRIFTACDGMGEQGYRQQSYTMSLHMYVWGTLRRYIVVSVLSSQRSSTTTVTEDFKETRNMHNLHSTTD